METPRKLLNKYWCSVPHYLSDIRNIYIKADRFPLMMSQQKLQSVCAVSTFDPQLKKILEFSVKDRYQLNYFICIEDFNAQSITSLKLNLFSFFIYCCQHHEVFIDFILC
jgi:hypothetical protein